MKLCIDCKFYSFEEGTLRVRPRHLCTHKNNIKTNPVTGAEEFKYKIRDLRTGNPTVNHTETLCGIDAHWFELKETTNGQH